MSAPSSTLTTADAPTMPAGPAAFTLTDDLDHLADLLTEVLAAVRAGRRDRPGPLPAGGPSEVAATVRRRLGPNPLPHQGIGARTALAELTRTLSAGAADPAHPFCAAHLHCPPLAVGVAADLAAAVLNQSLDSWDQAPAATELEHQVVRGLAHLVGYRAERAAGVVTSGGTESNLMGLLLARDGAPDAGLRVFCSRLAHFSVARGARLLGLPARAVVDVDTDADGRMDVAALDAALVEARRQTPRARVVVVGTAGTTDLGSIDPLPDLARVCEARDAFLHVDAAYGGGALFSDRLRPLLTGLARADSVALDLHKLGWLPIPAGVFLSRDRDLFTPLTTRVSYLNPADDERAGIPSLLGRSLRTTRRADVVKIAVALRALGLAGMGALVERCHDLAHYAADRITARPDLVLHARPVLTTVVFSYAAAAGRTSAVNAGLRRRLLFEGRAVIGRADLAGVARLKLTLLNPHATPADVDRLLDAVVAAGKEEER
ncbi:pyridoxal phosphate-dependent decarboxylase family protein [Actinopolymorpha pittospori]|uniref:L-2,4-diaminobutyrate decarboxylase n=1 Tax=Actinopolymorpha pittospori TaxID=648752 RepID=A0A927NCW0_9ACTN|nr:aminotransferase class I/II-fold pyridoxal phosphate-dependent enzyme [Actinopolymorpha pittospori]MBE1612520.1 L-2,4-diaminobutyrate decarboxylase [Actinopolymorpha pittospori]